MELTLLASSQLKTSAAKWSLNFWWILANLIGFGFAGAFFHNFPLAYSPSNLTRFGAFSLAPAIFGGLFFGAIPALLIGWSQRIVLRRYWPLSRWWILSASIGMGVMHFLSDGFENARDLSIAVLLGGLSVGAFQWLLLQPHLPLPGWWILANLIGWYLGWVIGIAILRSIGILYLPWVGGLEVKQHGILGVSAGLTSGLGTGLLLMWLLRNRAL
ncbi:MAG TPA: hypothetical protein VJ436_02355 [Anaerolineales bacterium]|nr:hypothetical protein [Anaerolineales bacterium]